MTARTPVAHSVRRGAHAGANQLASGTASPGSVGDRSAGQSASSRSADGRRRHATRGPATGRSRRTVAPSVVDRRELVVLTVEPQRPAAPVFEPGRSARGTGSAGNSARGWRRRTRGARRRAPDLDVADGGDPARRQPGRGDLEVGVAARRGASGTRGVPAEDLHQRRRRVERSSTTGSRCERRPAAARPSCPDSPGRLDDRQAPAGPCRGDVHRLTAASAAWPPTPPGGRLTDRRAPDRAERLSGIVRATRWRRRTPATPTAAVGEKATYGEYLATTGRRSSEVRRADAGAAGRPSVAASTMSLLGLVRHLAEVEHHWFQRVLERPADLRLYGPTRTGTSTSTARSAPRSAWTTRRELAREIARAERGDARRRVRPGRVTCATTRQRGARHRACT